MSVGLAPLNWLRRQPLARHNRFPAGAPSGHVSRCRTRPEKRATAIRRCRYADLTFAGLVREGKPYEWRLLRRIGITPRQRLAVPERDGLLGLAPLIRDCQGANKPGHKRWRMGYYGRGRYRQPGYAFSTRRPCAFLRPLAYRGPQSRRAF